MRAACEAFACALAIVYLVFGASEASRHIVETNESDESAVLAGVEFPALAPVSSVSKAKSTLHLLRRGRSESNPLASVPLAMPSLALTASLTSRLPIFLKTQALLL